MRGCKRLSICYAVPGHDLLASAGPTRNVLSVAEALSEQAHVTVVVRRVLEPFTPQGYEVVEVEPGGGEWLDKVDDAAVRGISVQEFVAYLGRWRRLIGEQRHHYDVVLEKSWILSGYLSTLCRRYGLPAAVVENVVRVWKEPLRNSRSVAKYAQHLLTQTLVGRFLRRTPLIIAETEELQSALSREWRLPVDRIPVVHLGVDHRLFHPLDQADARSAQGIALNSTVLLYVGGLDAIHNLTPVLEAMRCLSNPALELHIVGDGELRAAYEASCGTLESRVLFHGRVPHAAIPRYIAAADVCLAPYERSAFPNGQVAYSTLKVPEYMACARPVVSVPSGHILTLIQHGVSGFLFPHDVTHWAEFLRDFPTREQLRRMGVAAAKQAAAYSWDATASAYLALCEQLVQSQTTAL